jgi:hypothetical protein
MNLEQLARSLNSHNVKYIFTATGEPGANKSTQAIEIFIESTPINAIRVLDSLRDVGHDVRGLSLQEILDKKEIVVRKSPLAVSLRIRLEGTQFELLWKRRLENVIGKEPAFFANFMDLAKVRSWGKNFFYESPEALRKLQTNDTSEEAN